MDHCLDGWDRKCMDWCSPLTRNVRKCCSRALWCCKRRRGEEQVHASGGASKEYDEEAPRRSFTRKATEKLKTKYMEHEQKKILREQENLAKETALCKQKLAEVLRREKDNEEKEAERKVKNDEIEARQNNARKELTEKLEALAAREKELERREKENAMKAEQRHIKNKARSTELHRREQENAMKEEMGDAKFNKLEQRRAHIEEAMEKRYGNM